MAQSSLTARNRRLDLEVLHQNLSRDLGLGTSDSLLLWYSYVGKMCKCQKGRRQQLCVKWNDKGNFWNVSEGFIPVILSRDLGISLRRAVGVCPFSSCMPWSSHWMQSACHRELNHLYYIPNLLLRCSFFCNPSSFLFWLHLIQKKRLCYKIPI